MAKILIEENCGNAPKQAYVLRFLTAMANNEIDNALRMLSENAEVEVVGKAKAVGKDAIEKLFVKDSRRSPVKIMEIFTVMSHGNACAANGIWHFADGGKVAFNTMYTFDGFGKNARLKKVQTYSIVLDQKKAVRKRHRS